jgi:hypothetical protein
MSNPMWALQCAMSALEATSRRCSAVAPHSGHGIPSPGERNDSSAIRLDGASARSIGWVLIYSHDVRDILRCPATSAAPCPSTTPSGNTAEWPRSVLADEHLYSATVHLPRARVDVRRLSRNDFGQETARLALGQRRVWAREPSLEGYDAGLTGYRPRRWETSTISVGRLKGLCQRCGTRATIWAVSPRRRIMTS